uniref:Uncharacterized protein n=1 Tax=Panagrolaimus sp. JU765 TaxID=591449 RepID=A0AC34RBP3_9BILA
MYFLRAITVIVIHSWFICVIIRLVSYSRLQLSAIIIPGFVICSFFRIDFQLKFYLIFYKALHYVFLIVKKLFTLVISFIFDKYVNFIVLEMQEELFSMLPFKAVQIQQKEVQPVDNPMQPKGILRPTTEAPVVKPKNIGQLAEIAGNAICGKANQPQVTKPDPPKTVAKPDPPKTDKKVLPTQNNVAFGTRAPLPPNNPAAKITRPVHQPYMTPTAKEIQALKAVVEEQKTVISTLSEMITGLKNEVQHLKDQNANRDLQYDKLLELIDNQNLRLMKLEKLGPNIGKKTLGAMNELKKPKDSVALKKMTNNVARRERYDEEDPKCMYNMCMEYLKE